MKLKYYIPTSSYHLAKQIAVPAALFGFIIAVMVSSAHAMKEPYEYGENQCELIAKDYQKEYGGSLVWIQRLKPNGAYDLDEKFTGHVINKVYSKTNGTYYIDYQGQWFFKTEKEISDFYFAASGYKVEVFDLSWRRPPFEMYWYY